MKRRGFLTMLGAAGLVPALPMPVSAAPVAAGYNRYMYGLAVFHARTRASISATDLMARLKVSAVQAEAMMGEMTAKGVLTPVVNAAGGAARALDPHHASPARTYLRRAVRNLVEDVADEGAEPQAPKPLSATDGERSE